MDDSGESLEYRILLACKSKLITAIKCDISVITDGLESKSLLPLDKVPKEGSATDRARELVSCIIDRVKLSPVRYQEIVDILSEHPCLGKDITKALLDARQKLQEPKEDAIQGTSLVAKPHLQTRNCATAAVQTEPLRPSFRTSSLDEIPHKKSSHGISNPIVCFNELNEYDLEDLHAIMRRLTNAIKNKYAMFFDNVYKSFKESIKDCQRLRFALKNKHPIFRDEELANLKAVADVFHLILPHCSFFNYEVLESLVVSCGTPQDQRYLKEYTEHFSEYCKAMPCAEKICGQIDPGSERTQVIFKLDRELNQLKTDTVKSIKDNIAEHLGVKSSALHLSTIKEGCVMLKFFVPTFIVAQVFPLSDQQIIALYTEVKVLHIQYQASYVDIKNRATQLTEARKGHSMQLESCCKDANLLLSLRDRLEDELMDTVGHDSRIALENAIIKMDSDDEESSGSEVELLNEHSRVPAAVTDSSQTTTLASIIANQRFLEFHHFLKEQCKTRNLKFWLACKHYHQLSGSTECFTKVAKAVYIKFIKDSAPQKISLLPETKSKIKESLQRLKDEPLTVELFAVAQQEVCEVIERNELLQFIHFEDTQLSTCHHPWCMSYMANPLCDISVASSFQHSGDSTSLSSFSKGSDVLPASESQTSMLATTHRAVVNTQSEDLQKTLALHVTKNERVSEAIFSALVIERLQAVNKDRIALEQKVRNNARQEGKLSYDEIMSLQWYHYNIPAQRTRSNSHCDSKQVDHYIDKLAQQEVEEAVKEYEITTEVKRKRINITITAEQDLPYPVNVSSDSGLEGDVIGRESEDFAGKEDKRVALKHGRFNPIAQTTNPPQPHISPHQKMNRKGDKAGQRKIQSSCKTISRGLKKSSLSTCMKQYHTQLSEATDEVHHSGYESIKSQSGLQHKKILSRPKKSSGERIPLSSSATESHHQQQQVDVDENRSTERDILITYTYQTDGIDRPYETQLRGKDITLATFKEKVFLQTGEFRFFFMCYNEELETEVLEEYSDESVVLPLVEGKIVGHIEKTA